MKEQEIVIKLKGKEYKLPMSLMEIDYIKGKKLLENIDNHLEIISIMFDIKPILLLNIDKKIIKSVYELCLEVINKCNTPIYKEIKVGHINYKLKDNLTTRDYIDIDEILNDNKNMIEAGGLIMQKLYQQCKNPFMSYNKKVYNEFKMYNKFILKPLKNTLIPIDYTKLPVGYITAFFSYILNFKSVINKKYPSIFKENVADYDHSFEDEEDEKDKPVDEVWGWYATLVNICNEDKIQMDYWLDQPFNEFLIFVSYKVQKNQEELNKIKNKK